MSAVVTGAVAGWALLMASLLAVAAVHKISAVVRGRANEEPIALAIGQWPVSWGTTFLAAGCIESALVVALVLEPALGLLLTACLLLGYVPVLAQLERGQNCNCFGSWAQQVDSADPIRRNLILAAASGGAALLGGLVGSGAENPTTLLVVVTCLAAVLARNILSRLFDSQSAQGSVRVRGAP